MESERKTLQALIEGKERPHGSKIFHQINGKTLTSKQRAALASIIPAYKALISYLDALPKKLSPELIAESTQKLNEYLSVLRSPLNDVFVRQSDFKTSMVPEFFIIMFTILTSDRKKKYTVSGQRDLIIEITFDPRHPDLLVKKTQRVDVAVGIICPLVVNGKEIDNFLIPILAMENKTNFDKNMVSGVEHSVTAMKTTFPECLYYAIGEWVDMAISDLNYASTDIDEIYILRKQKRAEFRVSKSMQAIDSDLIIRIFNSVESHLDKIDCPKCAISTRMGQGLLVCTA